MIRTFKYIVIMLLMTLALLYTGCATLGEGGSLERDSAFSFIVTTDMRQFAGPEYQTSQYFMGTCEAVREIGKGLFMISPGDIDPPEYVSNTIESVLGEDYPWYPGVGNHESETLEDMIWLREWGRENLQNFTLAGPENGEETTYSFNYKNAHFIMLNQYYDGVSDIGTDGDVTEPLYNWLKNDLEINSMPFVFVFGHEPIVSLPDYHNGRHRHQGDNLDAHPENNHRFQQLLREHKVVCYFCGHTHNFSYSKLNGLWQIDSGHCRGLGDQGAQSTFLKVFVGKSTCWVEVYRDDSNGGPYTKTNTIVLD